MIIAIFGSPQSGKTTITAELSAALGLMGKNVLAISALDFAELDLRYGIRIPVEHSIMTAIQEPQKIRSCAQEVSENVYCLAPSIADSSFNLTFSALQAKTLYKTVQSIYDIVLVDCTSWKANALTGIALEMCKRVIFPVPSKVSAVCWYAANAQIFSSLENRATFVLNSTIEGFDFDTMRKGLPQVKKEPICLPYVPQLPYFESDGKLIFRDKLAGKQVKSFKQSVAALIEGVLKDE